MDGGKKLVLVVVLLAVIVGVVVLIVKKYTAAPQPPGEARKIERIDIETYELVERTGDEWNKLGHKEKLYKNPNTGKYTMASPMKCMACEEFVPHPNYQFPTVPARKPEGMTDDEMDIIIADAMLKAAEVESTYACPKCGETGIIGVGAGIPTPLAPGPRGRGALPGR